MELRLIDDQGRSSSTLAASDALFGRDYNEALIHQIVTAYDCRRMASLIRSAVRRRTHALRTGRKVSQMDERYLRRAESALYGELAAALDLPEEEVLPYIRRTCPQWPE